MKKTVFSVILFFLVLTCFTSCSTKPVNDSTESVFDKLNRLSSKSYEKLEINVITDLDDCALHSEFVITNDQVTYKVERFAEFVVGDEVPENIIVSKSGTAMLKNGEVTTSNGDHIGFFGQAAVNGKRFHFAESDFIATSISSGSFMASVKKPSEWFLGNDEPIENVTVEVTFNDEVIETILVCYDYSGMPVQNKYQFYYK